MNGKTCIIAKFHRADFVLYSHSGEGKSLSYSQINLVPNGFPLSRMTPNLSLMKFYVFFFF